MKSKLIFSGAVFAPVFLGFVYALFVIAGKWNNEYNTLTAYGHFIVWLLALGMVGIIFLVNIIQYIFFGKRCFNSLMEYFTEERYSRERKKAMFPSIKKELLFNKPTGLVLGSVGGGRFKKFVCINPKDKQISNHLSIIGTSSAGKSSGPILTSLVSNFMKDDEMPELTYLVVDVKPELAELSTKGSKYTRTINPKDRSAWGWDLYWAIDENSTEDEIYDVIKSIDTSDYSFGYIAAWSSDKDLVELKESMEIIQETSSEIIDGIDRALEEIRMESQKDVEKSISENLENERSLAIEEFGMGFERG